MDAVIVTTYLMLAAQNEGVGTCWVMHFDPNAIRERFKLPDNIEPVALLVMGYPAEDAKPMEFHFKFRPAEEIITYENFK